MFIVIKIRDDPVEIDWRDVTHKWTNALCENNIDFQETHFKEYVPK